MDALIDRHEREDKRRAMITSTMLYTLLIILLILPILHYPDPPPGQEGILVNLGADFGQGDENAPEESADTPQDQPEEETSPAEETQAEETPETPPEKTTQAVEEVPEKEVVHTTDPQAEAIKKREEERKRQEKIEADRKRKEQEEAERKRKAEEEANKKKEQIGGAFGGSTGSGKGNTGKQGNQGDPNGDPNAVNLEGVSVGTGNVGGGLSNRGVLSSPRITDNSQEQGTVVIKVCVDRNGKVISAEYTQNGSTTNSANLRKKAIANAKRWKFSKSNAVDKQCGTIKYTFKLQ